MATIRDFFNRLTKRGSAKTKPVEKYERPVVKTIQNKTTKIKQDWVNPEISAEVIEVVIDGLKKKYGAEVNMSVEMGEEYPGVWHYTNHYNVLDRSLKIDGDVVYAQKNDKVKDMSKEWGYHNNEKDYIHEFFEVAGVAGAVDELVKNYQESLEQAKAKLESAKKAGSDEVVQKLQDEIYSLENAKFDFSSIIENANPEYKEVLKKHGDKIIPLYIELVLMEAEAKSQGTMIFRNLLNKDVQTSVFNYKGSSPTEAEYDEQVRIILGDAAVAFDTKFTHSQTKDGYDESLINIVDQNSTSGDVIATVKCSSKGDGRSKQTPYAYDEMNFLEILVFSVDEYINVIEAYKNCTDKSEYDEKVIKDRISRIFSTSATPNEDRAKLQQRLKEIALLRSIYKEDKPDSLHISIDGLEFDIESISKYKESKERLIEALSKITTLKGKYVEDGLTVERDITKHKPITRIYSEEAPQKANG